MALFHSYSPSYYICHSKYSPLIKYRSFIVYLFIPGPWCIKPSQRKNHSIHCTQNHTMCICLPPIATSLANLCEIRNLHSNMKKKICLKIKNLIEMFFCIFWFLVSETPCIIFTSNHRQTLYHVIFNSIERSRTSLETFLYLLIIICSCPFLKLQISVLLFWGDKVSLGGPDSSWTHDTPASAYR